MIRRLLFWMFGWIIAKESAEKVLAKNATEAHRLWVEHEAAAEHHGALAEMYRKRYMKSKTTARVRKPKVKKTSVKTPTKLRAAA